MTQIKKLENVTLEDGTVEISTNAGNLGSIELFTKAVENAQTLVAKGDLTATVIGTRLLGKARAEASRDWESGKARAGEAATASFRSALQVFSDAASLELAAQAAYMLVPENHTVSQQPQQPPFLRLHAPFACKSICCCRMSYSI